MKVESLSIEKELQILRGSITQLSFVNKEADQELNMFLVEGIAGLRNQWAGEWDNTHEQLADARRKLGKLGEEHEDVEINRDEL
jgi:hypothetical protein